MSKKNTWLLRLIRPSLRAGSGWALIVTLIASVALAQQPTGSITLRVVDPSDALVPGAGIVIANKAMNFAIRNETSASGLYSLDFLPPGEYEVTVGAPGFKTARTTIGVQVGRVSPWFLKLEVGPITETVLVTAREIAVNPAETSLQGVITSGLVRDLPLNGRNFLDLGQLEPGVQLQDGGNFDPTKGQYTGLSVSSQSGQTTRITLDGIDISDESVGTTTLNLSQDSIHEFQISRSVDTSAGLSASGAINVVTKGGGNDIHGTAFLFGRSDRGAARIGDTKAAFDREQAGFNLGGPLQRDKLFWFVNYERNNQDAAVGTEIGGFPQFTKVWDVPFDERMVNARIDWTATSDVRAFYRFTHNFNKGVGTGAHGFGGESLSPFANSNNVNQHVAGVNFSTTRFAHSIRYGYLNFNNAIVDARADIPGLPQTLDPAGRPLVVGFAPFAGTGVGPNNSAPQRTFQDNKELRYDGSAVAGRHWLRWGALINRIRMNVFAAIWGSGPEIDIDFNAANQAVCGADPLCYPVSLAIVANGLGAFSDVPTLGFPHGGARNTRFHWYVADTWRANSRLSINYGVRYVYEPGQNNPDFTKPAELDSFRPGLSRNDRRDKNNFGPYLGIAWSPGSRWVARAGATVSYDPNLFVISLFERSQLRPPGIGFDLAYPPILAVRNPLTGQTIFDMTGADPSAAVTPGVNWVGMPLGTPGLIDAVFQAFDTFKTTSAAAAANYPSGPSIFEITRTSGARVFDPDYKTPYSFQLNAGIQYEIRPGLVISADYFRNRGVNTILRRDYNRVGADDTLNVANAQTAMIATHTNFGCPVNTLATSIDCAIAAGATIEDYAGAGLGAGEAAAGPSPATPNFFAFPGMNPNFNAMRLIVMQGLSTYNALQISLRGRLPNPGPLVKSWNVVASYSLSRLQSNSEDMVDFFNPVKNDSEFFGPSALDRTHMLSVANLFEVPGGLRLNSIWRLNSALPASILIPRVSGSPAEIFYTDLDGDGTVADPLPGTGRGAFGRSVKDGEALNGLISTFNATVTNQSLTPAGEALTNAGLFTAAQLRSLGAVANGGQPLPLAPSRQVKLDSFITTDLRVSRPIRLSERVNIEPAMDWFNLFNVANYDLPGHTLSGSLTGTPGSINGTTAANRPNRAAAGSGSFAQGTPRAWQLSVRVSF